MSFGVTADYFQLMCSAGTTNASTDDIRSFSEFREKYFDSCENYLDTYHTTDSIIGNASFGAVSVLRSIMLK